MNSQITSIVDISFHFEVKFLPGEFYSLKMVTCNYVFIWLILSWVISAQKDDSSYYSLLGVGLDASKDAIKRAYRSMILELHPDKFHGLNMTEEDEIAAKNKFIKVTEAYETLVDDEKRKQYDYSLSGVDYSFVEEPEPIDTFRKKPFKIFMQTKNSRMYFEASFPKPSIPDLIISLKVSYEDSLRVIDRIQKYFRRRICPHCKGVGGIPSTCDNCQGSGVHKRCSVGRSFESCVSSTCDACSGKGYQLSSKCPHCSSKGFIMEEDSVTVSIPVGTRSGCRIVIENAGHEGFDGARGNSVLEVQYIMPAGWTMDTETRDLTYTLTVGIDALLQGYSHKLALPTGEHFNVSDV